MAHRNFFIPQEETAWLQLYETIYEICVRLYLLVDVEKMEKRKCRARLFKHKRYLKKRDQVVVVGDFVVIKCSTSVYLFIAVVH